MNGRTAMWIKLDESNIRKNDIELNLLGRIPNALDFFWTWDRRYLWNQAEFGR